MRKILRRLLGALRWRRKRKPVPVGFVLPKRERVRIFLARLSEAPPARNAEEALRQIHEIMDGVEDGYSGLPKIPNPGLRSERMYGPFEDQLTRYPDGTIVARTRRQRIFLGEHGAIRIETLAGELILKKPGLEKAHDG